MTVYLCGVLHQLHSAIFQVDETDSHPPQQLQMFGVVCHEVLGPERRPAHTRLPERRARCRMRRKLKHGRYTAGRKGPYKINAALQRLNVHLPVRGGTGAALVHSTTNWFPQVAGERGVREQEASVRAGPIKVGVVQLLLRLRCHTVYRSLFQELCHQFTVSERQQCYANYRSV